ncbi:MAG: YicC/YloC family endoribonuclease [Bacteroidota bacterium]
MIQSMTGYGKATGEFSDKNIIVEIKTLNSRQLDVNSRINHVYRERELDIRSIITEYIIRGKVELSIFFDYKDAASTRVINKYIVESYISQLVDIAQDNNLSTDSLLDIAMKQPDVFNSEQITEVSEEEWRILKSAVITACEQIIEYRKNEGKSLKQDVFSNIQEILDGLKLLESLEKKRLLRIRERIENYLQEYVNHEKIDTNRLEQEMIYYIEKLDINEEKIRLQQHCTFFLETIEQSATGKKLGFIAQEIGREINTIGSKSNDADMQKVVVQMKDNLERIKEQVLNIL